MENEHELEKKFSMMDMEDWVEFQNDCISGMPPNLSETEFNNWVDTEFSQWKEKRT